MAALESKCAFVEEIAYELGPNVFVEEMAYSLANSKVAFVEAKMAYSL